MHFIVMLSHTKIVFVPYEGSLNNIRRLAILAGILIRWLNKSIGFRKPMVL